MWRVRYILCVNDARARLILMIRRRIGGRSRVMILLVVCRVGRMIMRLLMSIRTLMFRRLRRRNLRVFMTCGRSLLAMMCR